MLSRGTSTVEHRMTGCPEAIYPTMEIRIKDAILQVLEGPVRDHPLSEVIDSVSKDLDVSKAAVKSAIWELYADGLVQLTPDWDLRATGDQAAAAIA